MKLRIAITCLSACLLTAPALRAQDSPRVACYDLTVRIDVPERRVTVMKRLTVSIRSPPHPPGSFPTDAP